jgi:dsRNA-specific ribonuclease
MESIDTTKLLKYIPQSIKYAIVINPNASILEYLVKLERFDGVFTSASSPKNYKEITQIIRKRKLEDDVDIEESFDPEVYSDVFPQSVLISVGPLSKEILDSSISSAAIIVISRDTLRLPSNYTVTKDNNINIITPTEDYKYIVELRQFLSSYLRYFLVGKYAEIIPKLLTDDQMVTWIQAFTTESVNPLMNLENLEFLGDEFLDVCVARYLQIIRPDLHKSQIHHIKSMWTQKKSLGEQAMQSGFAKFIKTARLTKHVKEDVLEGFVGALVLTSDNVKWGLGYVNSYSFTVWRYKDDPILKQQIEKIARIPPKTAVQQWFPRLGVDKEEIIVNQSLDPKNNKIIITTIGITPKAQKYMKELGISFPSLTLGNALNMSKKDSELQAYENAFETMKKYGMSDKWVEDTNKKIIFNHPDILPYYLKALEKSKQQGYIDIKYIKPAGQTTFEGQIVTLIGIKENKEEVKISEGRGLNIHEAQIDAIKKYVL